MTCAVQSIKLLASAVEAGKKARKDGRLDNPFDGKNEELRAAFHIGLNVGDGTVKLKSEQELLDTLAIGPLVIAL